jgi:hypothetical protein
MKKLTLTAFMLFALVSITRFAYAAVLTFDDLNPTTGLASIPNGYGGFNWSQFGYANAASYAPGSGYDNGTVSGDYVAYNKFGELALIENGPFDFNSVYLTGAWNDGLNIRIRGFSEGALLYSDTVVVDTSGPTLFTFDWLGIDTLAFNSFGGVNVNPGGLGGSGYQFAMDNFTFNVVPIPAAIWLFGSGLLGLIGIARRKTRT